MLRSLFFLKTPTRNEIARHAGLSPITVTDIIRDLIDLGLVERAGKIQARSGRPSITYQFGAGIGHSVGVSLGAGSYTILAMDSRDTVVKMKEYGLSLSSHPEDHPHEIVEQISQEARRFIASVETEGRRALALGIAPPGMVDPERGIWLHGLQVTGINHIALRDLLEKIFSITVVVEDVARCLAFAEASRRPPDQTRDLAYLYLGLGVGAGVIIGHELLIGAHGLAGEIGHLVVDEKGERCSCGNIGCLETVISRTSILERFQRRLSEGVISTLQRYRAGGATPLTLEAIRDALASGDRLAHSTLFEIGTFLGDACSKIIKLYNPRTLVIGGPVAVLGEYLREPLMLKVRQKVIPEMLVDLTIDIAASGPREEALGAALLAKRRYWRHVGTTAATVS